MATLTTNLFRGQGPGDDALEVVEGHWPTDLAGHVFIVGPDKREPGGHWFGEPGLLCRIDVTPDAQGRIRVRRRRVDTPVSRLRARFPRLFRKVQFAEVSPFGVTNLANTNVAAIDGRLFLGYDAGRPVEVDPVTLDHLTAVGANDEWLCAVPGLVEPLVSVAAHPAPAYEERALYFVNYSPFPGQRRTSIARWGLNGPVERWPLDADLEFDSIHDIKATRDHLVFTDLPFVMEPATLRGGDRTLANQDVTRLFIVRKADLRAVAPGTPVPVTQVEIPFPTGHLSVDEDDAGGELTVYLEHIPLADLTIRLAPDAVDHRNGRPFDAEYEGMVTTAIQPGAVGRYRIDAASGEVLDGEVAWDDRFWGPILATRDESTDAARAHQGHLWYVGCGFDPDLVPEEWWRLYGDGSKRCLVDPADLPVEGRPGALAHFDLQAMKVTDVFAYADGAFPSPPTFVPRAEQSGPGDGYVVVLVHADGQKELQVFDAQDIGRGPLARATAPGFNPPLLLHATWMPERVGPRPSSYRVPVRADVLGALRVTPGILRSFARLKADAERAGFAVR